MIAMKNMKVVQHSLKNSIVIGNGNQVFILTIKQEGAQRSGVKEKK